MARPPRNNVDYFPFYCEDGNKMFYIEETYGNDGFATFIKILRELAKTNFHYLDLSKPTTIMFLSAKCKITKETLNAIIKDLVDLGKFDKTLWEENQVIWCQDFIDSIQDAYLKRNNKCITYEGLLQLLTSLGVRKPSKLPTKAPVNPQSKVEYNKEEEIKENIYIEFLEKNYPSKLEAMKSKIPISDRKHFFEFFNNKCILEDVPMDFNKINARFNILQSNWNKDKPKEIVKPLKYFNPND